MRILAVDDDTAFLDYLRELVRILGFTEARYLSSGAVALDEIALSGVPHECFLLDLRMPGLDGIELTRRIRALPPHARTPVFVITGARERGLIDAAFDAGATDFVTKPLDLHQLRGRLGMAWQLSEENRRRLSAEAALRDERALRGPEPEFDQPVALRRTEGLVDYLAMENYLLSTGRMRCFDRAALCLRLRNAASLFRAGPRIAFMAALNEVAVLAAGRLGGEGAMIAYAGSGDFICLVPRGTPPDPATLEAELNAALVRLHAKRGDPSGGPPTVCCGAPVAARPLSRSWPAELIREARQAARLRCAAAGAQVCEPMERA